MQYNPAQCSGCRASGNTWYISGQYFLRKYLHNDVYGHAVTTLQRHQRIGDAFEARGRCIESHWRFEEGILIIIGWLLLFGWLLSRLLGIFGWLLSGLLVILSRLLSRLFSGLPLPRTPRSLASSRPTAGRP